MDKTTLHRIAGSVACLALLVLAMAAVRLAAIVNASPEVAAIIARALAFPG